MKYNTRRIQTIYNKAHSSLKPLLQEFQEQIEQIQTARGSYSEQSTFHAITSLEYFYREKCMNSFENWTIKTITDYCNSIARPGSFLPQLRRFNEILVSHQIISLELINSLQKLHFKDRAKAFEKIGEEYKFIIKKERWEKIYSHPKASFFSTKFAIYMGLEFLMRRQEITHSQTTDLFIKAEDPFIFIQPHEKDKYFEKWDPKTVDSIRRLYLAKQQVKQIENYLIWRKLYLESVSMDHDYLIFSREGTPIQPGSLYRWINNIDLDFIEYGKLINRKLRTHVLRYSGAWFYYEKTQNIYALSQYMGHSSIDETENYLGLSKAQKFKEIKQMIKKALHEE